MQLQAPAGLNDFDPNEEDLRAEFMALWNSNERRDGFLGYYVAAAAQLPNYVDPRAQAPGSDPTQVPWNGFPKLISRWFGDETSDAAREQAEEAADTLATLVYWLQPSRDDPGRLRTFSCSTHQLPFYASRLGDHVLQLARPRRIVLPDGTLGPELVEQYRQQDEYLEWHSEADPAGKLTALTFTAEPPDYWLALARISPEKVVSLYKSLVSEEVREEDLFFQGKVVAAGIDRNGRAAWYPTGEGKGDYNPLNAWTTSRGIMHLTHPANTLGAEVNLAKDASQILECDALPPPTPGQPSAEVRRIACGQYGGINRSSDPLIGLGVGDVVNDGLKLSLTDPVGLYIANCDLSSLRGPQGEVVAGSKTVVRGRDDASEPRIVRLRVSVPEALGFKLGDCKLANRNLRRGGQVARLMTMTLYVQTYAGPVDSTSAQCAGIPCRNPSQRNLFVAGDPGGCPPGSDSIWLLETPYVEVGAMTDDFAFSGTATFFNVLREAGNAEFFSGPAPSGQRNDEGLEIASDAPPAAPPVASRAPLEP